METFIQPEYFSEQIFDRLFNQGFSASDMEHYIENCFTKFISDSIKFYEEM